MQFTANRFSLDLPLDHPKLVVLARVDQSDSAIVVTSDDGSATITHEDFNVLCAVVAEAREAKTAWEAARVALCDWLTSHGLLR